MSDSPNYEAAADDVILWMRYLKQAGVKKVEVSPELHERLCRRIESRNEEFGERHPVCFLDRSKPLYLFGDEFIFPVS